MNKEELMIVVYTTHGHTYSFYEVSNIKYHNKNLEFDYKGFAGETHAQFNDITGITKHYGIKNPNKKHDKDKQFYNTLTDETAAEDTSHDVPTEHPSYGAVLYPSDYKPHTHTMQPVTATYKAWTTVELIDYMNDEYPKTHLALDNVDMDYVWMEYWKLYDKNNSELPFFDAEEFINNCVHIRNTLEGKPVPVAELVCKASDEYVTLEELDNYMMTTDLWIYEKERVRHEFLLPNTKVPKSELADFVQYARHKDFNTIVLETR